MPVDENELVNETARQVEELKKHVLKLIDIMEDVDKRLALIEGRIIHGE